MVAIITGTGYGLQRSSLALLGAGGTLGSAQLGRGGQNVYVNAATGSLNVQREDEVLIGRGPDLNLATEFSNGSSYWHTPNWTSLYNLTGTANTAGSTITRWTAFYDQIVYTYEASRGAYVNKEGAGAHDEVRFANGVWSFIDGDTRQVEYYEQAFYGHNLVSRVVDADGNTQTYTYDSTGGCIARITNADGSYVEMTNTNWRPNEIKTSYKDANGVDAVMTRVRYSWDPANTARLLALTVDLTPNDNSIADGNFYRINYTYDGSTQRLTAITQTDGSRLDIGYDASGRVISYTETISAGVTATTTLSYEIDAYGNRYTRVRDSRQQDTFLYYDSKNQLTKIVSPPPVPGAAAATVSYAYNADGDLVSVTDALGNTTTYAHDSNGNVISETDSLGNVVTRTYGSKNELLTETRSGSDSASADALHTTRYAYDSENHLRYVVGAEGRVTEHRYDRYGQQVAQLEYLQASYNLAGLGSGTAISEASLNAWVSGLSDRSQVKRTNTYYDGRGNVTSLVSYASVSRFGEGADSPLAITPGAHTTVTQEPDGLYRITKTSGSGADWDSDAHSLMKMEGDFVLRLRPGQNDKNVVGGMSTAPAISASYTDPEYGFYFVPGGPVYYMEKGSYVYLGVNHNPGDNFWLARVGNTISYYKGATYEAAVAAGALRTRTGPTEALYFDSSFYTTGAILDVGFTPLGIKNGANTSVEYRSDGLYRITKTAGGQYNWDADARSTTKADGDFVLRVRPGQNNAHVVAGVAASPHSHSSYTNPDYGFYFDAGSGMASYMEAGSYSSLGVSHAAGDNFWLVRSGSTISYYKGATLEAAVAAGALRTRTGAIGTLYFDSSLYSIGATVDVAFTPAPVYNGTGTSVAQQSDGLYRITKTLGWDGWDADARSSTKTDGDFVLRLRPTQSNKYFVGGVSTQPSAHSSYYNPEYGLFFLTDGTVYFMESGNHSYIGANYTAGDNFWVTRVGNTISYYKGATLEAAMAAGALRTRTGVSGTFHFDSSLYSNGAAFDMAFTPLEANGASAAVSRVNFVYNQAGQLVSRFSDGQKPETFLYDGLGRMIGSTDPNGGTTNIAFNDAGTQTVITLANGLVQTSTYNKVGELVSKTESGSYVAGGTSTYKYDKLGRMRMSTDATGINAYFLYDRAGRLVAEINHAGHLTEYRYDANARLIATMRYTNAINTGYFASLADPDSTLELATIRPAYHSFDVCAFQFYDKEGRVIATVDGSGAVQSLQYDRSGRLVKTTSHYNKLASWQIDGFKSNTPLTLGLPAADSRDSIARNFYDKDGLLLGALDGEGYLSRIVYDKAGQKLEEISYLNATNPAYRAAGTLNDLIATTPAHADDRRTRFAYDGNGFLRFQLDGLNQVTELTYDAAGKVTSTVRYAGSINPNGDYSYDNILALVANSGLVGSPATRGSWSVYDAAGRLAYSIDSEDAVTRFSYDAMGQVTKTVQYAARRSGTIALPSQAVMDGWAAANDGNAANRVTRHYYSARGERRFTVDAEGYVSRTDFDAEGRTTREVRWDSPLGGVHDGWTIDTVNAYAGGTWADTRYGYDFGGALTDVWNGENNWVHYNYYANGTLASKHVVESDPSVTYFHYDGAGRVVAEYAANGTSVQANTFYAYDGHGNVVSVTDPRGNVTTRTYDKTGQMVTETNAAGTVTFQYDAFGQAVKSTDARGYSSYSYYDRVGRLVAARDAEDYVTETSYNVFGEATSVTRRYNRANNGAAVGVLPTYAAHAQDATTSFEYDRLGRMTKSTDAEGHYEQYTLDAWGNRITVRNKIGGIISNSYDRRGLLVAETLPMASYDSNGNVVAWTVTNRFQHDARGNRIKKIEADGLPEKRTTTYVYDKANRLIESRGDAVSVISQGDHASLSTLVPTDRFKYDQAGRLIETVDALGARTLFYYDKMGRKSAEVNALGKLTTFAYDQNGNVVASRAYGTAIAVPATAGGPAPAAPGGEYRETTYTYDALNRVKTSSVANVRTGAWNGSYYATSVGTVTTSFDYDSNGNVIRTTDGNGVSTYTFYDRLNRKIAHVDRENYLSFYTLDGEGNALQEDRYATRLSVAVGTYHDPNWLRSIVAGNAADRITQFGYDRNGRRTSEWRLYINSNYVSGNSIGADGTHGGIQYNYNGLGQVWQKTFGNGDYVSYSYDSMGRLTQENRAPFTDHAGASVRPTTFYYYNGLNSLTLSRQGGTAQAGTDRLTRYTYGAGGRMTAMTDAAGNTYNYYHDAAGNVLRENYNRTKADGSTTLDGLLYTRDILGRVTSQGLATWVGYWAKADTQDTAYNVYGDVSQRGVNGGWQEQFAYDGAGRMWRSNSGDGVWRFYVHDGNGKQTLSLESEGANLAGYSLDQALSVATAGGAYYVGGAYIDGINATINVYDKRGQAIQTRMPQRQLNDTSAAVDLAVSRTYNAFGDVASETDARGATTEYFYNTMGRVIERRAPLVNQTGENGVVTSARPTTYYYYDRAGRLIGARDPNGNLTTRHLLAGTGHDGSEALVTYEFHADGGYRRNDYDVFGDVRISWDEISRRTDMSYDAMGRLVQQTKPSGLVEYYAYDLLGQRTQHWNNVLQTPIYGPPEQRWVDTSYYDPYYGWVYDGYWETYNPIVGYAPDKEITDYDVQGRVTRQVAFGGDTTTTTYAWNAGIATAGMGTFGGWTETTTMANGRASTEQTDLFGRQVYKSDLGGHVYTFSYDFAGRMTQRSGGETLTYTWLNTGKIAQSFSMTGAYGGDYTRKGTTYGYDANGNLTSERLVEEGQQTQYYWDPYDYTYYSWVDSWSRTYKNATATYDALNRVVTWAEAGSANMASASTSFEYDLTNNIRRSNTVYRAIDNNGNQTGYNSAQDNWYRYDSMNRLVTKGSLVNGQITRAGGGVDYLYDKAGQRVSATRTTQGEAYVYNPYYYYDPYYGYGNQYMLVYYDAEVREDYAYDANGVLTSVRIAQGGYTDNGDGTVTPTAAPAYAALRASYTNDLMGRVTRQIDWQGDGTSAAYDRTVTYNAKGQVTNETIVNKQGYDTITTYSSHDFGSGSNYALGAIVYTYATTYKNGAYQSGSSTTTNYAWYDGAVQSTITTTQSTTHTTTFYYDGSGNLSSLYVGDGRPRSVTFVNDANGQAIKRDESDNNWNQYTGGDPHEIWHRFGGKLMGSVGNNGTLDTDYATSIANRTRTPGTGAFRFGTSYGSMTANFDLSNEAITSYSQGVAAGGYTVRQGDTLETIAAQLWGDSSLWYRLAEANGMTAPNGLSEGQRITIPAGVMKNHHNASTFKPFDPSETLGEVNPNTPQPQKATKRGGKCGIFGQILLVVIAVAVTAITYGALGGAALTGLSAVGAGAVSGAAGSIASQAFGLATGIQEKFSWKGVAMAAIGGAVGGALGPKGLFGADGAFSGVKNSLLQGALRGAAGSIATQGIGLLTGLQKKFDFVGVAAAAAGGAAGSWTKGKLGEGFNKYAGSALVGSASAIASAATRTLLEGSDFGDNLLASLPDIIGSTIGNMIADPIVEKMEQARQEAAAAEAAAEQNAQTAAQEQQATQQPTEDLSGTVAEAGTTLATIADPEDIPGFAGGQVTIEEARVAVEALRVGLPPKTPGSQSIPFGLNDRYRTGSDPVTAWLVNQGLLEGRAYDWDDYVGDVWGGNADGMGDLLFRESQPGGPAAGQTHNQIVILGYLAGQGSRWATPVAQALYRRTPEARLAEQTANSLPLFETFNITGESPNTLSNAFDSSFILGARHYMQRNPMFASNFSNGYIFTNPTQTTTRLTGWQRLGAGGLGLLHTVLAFGSGAGAIATSELCATVIGCAVPVALGAGAVFEADNAQTQFRRAWSGEEKNTLGGTAISTAFDISPDRAENYYTVVQLGTGLVNGRSLMRGALTNSDGFLIGSVNMRAPMNIPAQRFGSIADRVQPWGLQVGDGMFVNRTFVAIKPSWNPLTQLTTGTITRGTPMRFGIIGPQGWRHPGGLLQFNVRSTSVTNQTTRTITR